MQEKQAWTGEIAPRYRQSDKKGKTKIPDEFVKATGYNRNYALHILTHWGKETFLRVDGKPVTLKAGTAKRRKGGGRKPVYGPDVLASLRRIWAFFWYPCGKLLSPLIQEQMIFFQPWPSCRITGDVREKLMTISPATIDRALKQDRNKLAVRGICGTKPGKLLKKHIPTPGMNENPGSSRSTPFITAEAGIPGSFALPLPPPMSIPAGSASVHSSIKPGNGSWKPSETSMRTSPSPSSASTAITARSSSTIPSAPGAIPASSPSPEPDPTRETTTVCGPPVRVEQKNFKCVRDYVGYHRFDASSEHQALARVYRSLCPLLNYFLPTVKLIDKQPAGSKVRKVYDKPQRPYQRLMACQNLPDEVKTELSQRYQRYNPVLLQQEVHRAVDALMEINRRKELMRHQSLTDAALETI